MKCWKSAIRTWTRKEREKQKEKQSRPVKQKPEGLRGRSITDSLADTSWAE